MMLYPTYSSGKEVDNLIPEKPEQNYPPDINDFYLDNAGTIKMHEIACNCGCHRAMMSKKLFYSWQKLRYGLDKPIVISRGFSCWEHHVKIYQRDYPDDWEEHLTYHSKHLTGEALDMYPPEGITVDEFAEAAANAGFTYIIKYSWGIHADVRPIGRKTPYVKDKG